MKTEGLVKHRFVCSDTSTGQLIWIDENATIERTIDNVSGCFDIWVLPDKKILYPTFGKETISGFVMKNNDGSICERYQTEHEVFCIQPLENGNVLVGELGQKRIVEVTPEGKIAVEIPIEYDSIQHECMRMVRKYQGIYYVLMPGTNQIRLYKENGTLKQIFSIRHDAFGFVVLENNEIAYTSMEGAFILNQNGNEVWSLIDADVPNINIRWLLGIQLLENGNLVFSNWMGHRHLDEGIHFFEVNREKQIVWTFDGRGTLKTPAILQIIDDEEDVKRTCYRPAK